MSTGTVSVHSWNDSTYTPNSRVTSQKLSSKQKAVGAIDGTWVDNEDDGYPEMGQSCNAKLQPRPGFRASRETTTASRGWGRPGRGLRSNPVRPQRYGVEDEEGEEAGW